MKNVEDVNCTASLTVVSVWIEVMDSSSRDMLQACISEFTQKDSKTRVRDKRGRVITCIFCRDLKST